MDHADAPGRPQKERCDYLFFGDDNTRCWVVPLELKRGSVRASKIAAQLQARAEVSEQLVGTNGAVRFVPVAAYGSMHRRQFNSLARPQNHVRFRGKTYKVELLKCGASLVDALRA